MRPRERPILRTVLGSLAGIGTAALLATASPAADLIGPGDYVITQESPAARQAARSETAGAAIFLLKRSGRIETLAKPPTVTGPRGIRLDRDGTLVFADPIGVAIRRLTRQGAVETIHRGAPLSQPKDVAVDHDGGYVIADFPSFARRSGGKILKLSRDGKIMTLHAGAPLVWPHGVAVDRQGNIVIADHTCCIYRLTPDGEVSLVARGGPLVAPQDIKIDSDGSYVVTDIGMVIDASGRADRARSRNPGKLLRVSPSGQVSVIAMLPRARFRAVAPAADGGWLVVDMAGNALYRYDARGQRETVFQGPPLSEPAGVVEVNR